MIPSKLANSNSMLDDQLRYIDYTFNSSSAPPKQELETIGQLVIEAVISESNCKLGDALVMFNVEHRGMKTIPPGLKNHLLFDLAGSDKDCLTLEATITWSPELKRGDKRTRTVNKIPIYEGYDFRQLWAVWRSWMNAGHEIVNDLAELFDEERIKELERKEEETKEAVAEVSNG